MINIRQKGAGGEREICDVLNTILKNVMTRMNYPAEEIAKAANSVQRNQNQTAVGGNDLSNTFGMSIEVKRQEQLAINGWWAQCVAAADRNQEHPVLLYRQNGKKWQCVTLVYIELPNSKFQKIRASFDFEQFKTWYEGWGFEKLTAGEEVRS